MPAAGYLNAGKPFEVIQAFIGNTNEMVIHGDVLVKAANNHTYKDRTQAFIDAQCKKGNFVYANQKSQSWFTTIGLQLPEVVQTFIDSFDTIVYKKIKSVNSNFIQSSSETDMLNSIKAPQSELLNEEIEWGKEMIWNVAEGGKSCEECYKIAQSVLGEGNVTRKNPYSAIASREGKNSQGKGSFSVEIDRENLNSLKSPQSELLTEDSFDYNAFEQSRKELEETLKQRGIPRSPKEQLKQIHDAVKKVNMGESADKRISAPAAKGDQKIKIFFCKFFIPAAQNGNLSNKIPTQLLLSGYWSW